MKLAYLAMCAPMVFGAIERANSVMEFIVLLAASITGLGIVWMKMVRPISMAVAHVLTLQKFQNEVITRLEVIEGALYGTGHLEHLPIRRRNDPPYAPSGDNP